MPSVTSTSIWRQRRFSEVNIHQQTAILHTTREQHGIKILKTQSETVSDLHLMETCDLAWHFTREVAVSKELEMTVVSSRVVLNVHFTVIVHPQTTNDDVIHCSRHFTPRVVIVWWRKQQVSYTWQWRTNNRWATPDNDEQTTGDDNDEQTTGELYLTMTNKQQVSHTWQRWTNGWAMAWRKIRWRLILSCCKMNCERDNVKNRPQIAKVFFLKTELRKLEFSVFEFWGRFGSVRLLEKQYPTFSLGSAHPSHFSVQPIIKAKMSITHAMSRDQQVAVRDNDVFGIPNPDLSLFLYNF